MEIVTTWETTFWNKTTRNNQNFELVLNIIKNSLSKSALIWIQFRKSEYTIGEYNLGGVMLRAFMQDSFLDFEYTIGGNDVGGAILKVVMQESCLNSTTTISAI